MRFVFDFLYLLAAIALSPVIIYRMVRFNRYRTGWSHRFGKIHRKDPALRKCIWLHAVSVGEVNATKTIVSELKNKFSQFEIVMTVTTDTGFARATEVFGESVHLFYFPFDFSPVMRRAFTNIQPTVCLLMELEVWPNFLETAYNFRAPVIVVNGRISDRSFSRYKKIKVFAEEIFRRLSLVLAQTEQYASRFKELGCKPAR